MKLKECTISANTGLDAIKRAPIVGYDTKLKCIRIQDISQEKEYLEWGNTKTTDKDYEKFKLRKNDLLVARTGATVGVSYIVKKDVEAVFNNGTIRLRFDDSINPNFVYYIFKTNSFLQYIDNVSCVATQPNLRVENLLRFDIPDFDIEMQNKIVDILSIYDELIENNNKRIKILEQMAENLYKEWFVRFRFPGYETAEFKNGIPKGWEYIKLGEIVSFIRGISYSSEEIDCDDGLNLINLKNIQAFGGFRWYGTKKYKGKYKPAQIVHKGDLIMGVTDMTQDRRTVGSVALVPYIDGKSVISADLVKVISDTDNIFLYCMCRYGFYSRFFSQFANGANVLHLKPDTLLNKKVLYPDTKIIERFVAIVSPIMWIMDEMNNAIDNANKQRDLLLPRLMSGKLEVKSESLTNTKSKVISFDDFVKELGMAARAKTISDNDLRAMYEAYIDDDATE